MNTALSNALLSMDAYNRGYNAGIKLTGQAIGNVNILPDSSATIDPSTGAYFNDAAVGFYAIAYQEGGPTGPITIAYRGTDNLGLVSSNSDIWNGWTTGLGAAGTQALMAFDFYNAVVNGGSAPTGPNQAPNVTLVGHSLGGGLAGFVADLYGEKAVIYDNMAFERAANDNDKIEKLLCEQRAAA